MCVCVCRAKKCLRKCVFVIRLTMSLHGGRSSDVVHVCVFVCVCVCVCVCVVVAQVPLCDDSRK